MTSLLPGGSDPVVGVPQHVIHGTQADSTTADDLPASSDITKLVEFPLIQWFDKEVKDVLITINHKLDRLTEEVHQHKEVYHESPDAHPCMNLAALPVSPKTDTHPWMVSAVPLSPKHRSRSDGLFKHVAPMPQPCDVALLSDVSTNAPLASSCTPNNTKSNESALQPKPVASKIGKNDADEFYSIDSSQLHLDFIRTRSVSSGLSKHNKTHDFDVEALKRIRSRGKATTLIWELLEEPELVTGGKFYAWMITLAIIASALLSLAQTLEGSPISGMCPAVLEVMFESAFSMEILLRFFACPSKTVFFSIAFNWIDIAASIVALSLRMTAGFIRPENWQASISWTALLGLVPILKLLKLSRRFVQLHLLSRAFTQALEALPVLLYTMCILVLTAALMIFLVEPESNVPSLPSAVWLTIVTATTVGYGDMVPETNLGKLVVSVLTFASALYMAMPIGMVGSSFSAVWADRDRLVLVHRTKAQLRQAGYSAKDVSHLFYLFDADCDGHLSYKEFQCMIHEMRIGMSEARTVDLFQTFDADGSGFIDQAEFVKFLFPATFTQHLLGSVSDSLIHNLPQTPQETNKLSL